MHDYDAVLDASLHEMVYVYNSVINPDMSLWLDEGMALYLTNGEPFNPEWLDYMEIPIYSDIQTNNPLTFSDMGGYTFTHTYINYIINEYGFEAVRKLIRNEDYANILGVSVEEVCTQWVNYIKA